MKLPINCLYCKQNVEELFGFHTSTPCKFYGNYFFCNCNKSFIMNKCDNCLNCVRSLKRGNKQKMEGVSSLVLSSRFPRCKISWLVTDHSSNETYRRVSRRFLAASIC